jgi:hypothetical protein
LTPAERKISKIKKAQILGNVEKQSELSSPERFVYQTPRLLVRWCIPPTVAVRFLRALFGRLLAWAR